jgi:response regulator RpfG family c-di-GMP phosphodiesterase
MARHATIISVAWGQTSTSAFRKPPIPDILTPVSESQKSVLHVGAREFIIQLRDQILRLHGFEVVSTGSLTEAPEIFQTRPFDLVLVDVEGQGRVPQAEQLCADIRTLHPHQKVAFVCNYTISIDSDCPDEILQADFNPIAFVDGVKALLP